MPEIFPEYNVELRIYRLEENDSDPKDQPKEVEVFKTDKVFYPHQRWNEFKKAYDPPLHNSVTELMQHSLLEAENLVAEDECEETGGHEFHDGWCDHCGAQDPQDPDDHLPETPFEAGLEE